MTCPHCGTKHFEALETRQTQGGIKRVRLCFNGHRFVTIESVLQEEDNHADQG